MSVWFTPWWFMYFTVMSIVHEINSSFDCDPTIDISRVFLDISKAFDKIWHEGILFKLKTYGVDGEVLTLLTNYLHECYQRVLLFLFFIYIYINIYTLNQNIYNHQVYIYMLWYTWEQKNVRIKYEKEIQLKNK